MMQNPPGIAGKAAALAVLEVVATERPEQLPSHRFQPMLPDLLELVASERPGLLAPLVTALAQSPAADTVHGLARSWGLGPDTLLAALRQAAGNLDELERRRGRWRSEPVAVPNARAVCCLAAARADRVSATRHVRLKAITRKLADACELERTRQWIGEFLAAPPPDGARDLVRQWFGERQGGDRPAP